MTWKLDDGGPWTYIDRPASTASGHTFVLRYGPTSPQGEATWVRQVVGPDGAQGEVVRYWPRPRAVRRTDLTAWLIEKVHDAAAAHDSVGFFAGTHPWLLHTET